jgi:hypothetical protein
MSRKRPCWHRPRHAVKWAREGPFASVWVRHSDGNLSPGAIAGAFLFRRPLDRTDSELWATAFSSAWG